MRKIVLRRRQLVVALVVAVALLLVSGVAYAVVSIEKPMPATVTVNLDATPEGALGFYSDSGGTVPVTTLDFGELKPGVTGMVTVHGKNLTGSTRFRYFSIVDDLEKGSASIWPEDATDVGLNSLSPGWVMPFDFFLTLDSDISPGVHEFTIIVNATTN